MIAVRGQILRQHSQSFNTIRTEMKSSSTRSWAIFFAREVLGLIFFMAGVYKIFQLGPLNHARKYFLPFAGTFLPVWSLWATGAIIPFV
jgi:uncharacterized membrane protein YphA (DoxX/SURF4 family)